MRKMDLACANEFTQKWEMSSLRVILVQLGIIFRDRRTVATTIFRSTKQAEWFGSIHLTREGEDIDRALFVRPETKLA